ncbi:MAG TPA: DUF4232 domain-containing protein [Gaiellaceae bacterium]|nr:DUF4232 domain-containing protein [Gaiellaceae bacterium]
MTRGALVVAAVAALAQVGGASANGVKAVPCTGKVLRGTFTAVPGSEGAGNIVYALRLRNASSRVCAIKGLPRLQLLGREGVKHPTAAVALHPAQAAATLVTLDRNKTAALTARFSPDVPGPGEHVTGRCEPVSAKLRVSPPGGGSLIVAIAPPTSVCEHGGMTLSVLAFSR